MKRILKGSVIKISGLKTIKVRVLQNKIHKKYHKVIAHKRSYLVHDPLSRHVVGDAVQIIECRPISKLKSFIIRETKRNDS